MDRLGGGRGIQEEAITIKKRCITRRHTSARWETILLKSNILFPPDRENNLDEVIKDDDWSKNTQESLWRECCPKYPRDNEK